MSDRPLTDPRAIWAKLGNAANAIPHPLICHMLDTATVAESLWDSHLGPHIQGELEECLAPLGNVRRWVSLFCGWHDLGKCSPGFQGLRADIAMTLLGPTEAADIDMVKKDPKSKHRFDTAHGFITTLHIKELLLRWGTSQRASNDLAVAIGGHHGHYPSAAELQDIGGRRDDVGGENWERIRVDLADWTRRLLDVPLPNSDAWAQVRVSVPAALGLASLTIMSDWIASGEMEDVPASAQVDVDRYVTESLPQLKSRHIGWERWKPATTDFTEIFANVPRPIQREVASASGSVEQPEILTVAAPTGEGKTKLALQAAATIVKRFGLTGFYFASPTRLGADFTYEVSVDMMRELSDAIPVWLLHSTFEASLRRIDSRRTERFQEIGIDETSNCAAQADEWFQQGKKQGLAAAAGVGTFDRTCDAVLRGNHHVPLPLVALSSKVVIFDEVHSYDAYMNRRFSRLLWWLGYMRVPVIVLSATLSSRLEDWIISTWRAGANGRGIRTPKASGGLSYPRFRRATAADVLPPTAVPASRLNCERRLQIEPIEDSEVIDEALRRATDDKENVAIMRYTVSSINMILEQLKNGAAEAGLPEPIVLHKQLPPEESEANAARLIELLGPDAGSRRPQGLITVGTSALEQSLDLDFDCVITDLVPIDSLIQRAGRVWRHRETTPGQRLKILVSGWTRSREGLKFNTRAAGQDPNALLFRTWALLQSLRGNGHTINTPADVPWCLDTVYDDPHRLRSVPGTGILATQWDKAEADLKDAHEKLEYEAKRNQVPMARRGMRLSELSERRTVGGSRPSNGPPSAQQSQTTDRT